MKWLELIKLLVPIIIPVVSPKLAPLAPVIATGINEAEQLPGASGQDKLNHVINLATTTATGINAATGKTVVDPQHVTDAAASVISTIVDVANIIHDATPTTPVK